MADARFYVYALKQGDVVAYVGKGSGKRLEAQKRKFRLDGDKLETFTSEAKALIAERKWILILCPELNRCAGGNGGRVKRRIVRSNWERMIARNSRGYAARLLLGVERSVSGLVDPSKLEAIRQVANARA